MIDEQLEKELLPQQALRESLEMSDRGQPKQTIANVVKILREDPFLAGAIQRNEFTERIDITRDLGWQREGSLLTDTDMSYLTLYLETNYGISYASVIEKGLDIVSNENRYHPVRDLLNSLVWDGIPRLENALFHFLGVEKSELANEALKIFMLGAVARVFTPGTKFELSICLVGEQGAGKSTFLRFLAINDEWFLDDIRRLDDERIAAKLQAHLIVELAELLAFLTAKNNEEIKSALSRQSDNYRTPYEQHPRDRKRQCVFAGTSNRLEILPADRSGNRRIVPIETHMDRAEVHILADEATSRAYILQMWAEIMVIYRSGDYSLTLPPHLVKELSKYQAQFTPEDSDAEAIEGFLEITQEKYVCVTMLAYEALHYSPYQRISERDRRRISEIMRSQKGWCLAGTQRFKQYGTQRAWKRVLPNTKEQEDV